MKLVPTCERPEQYLIVHQRQPVGHLRLWDGYFCAHYPNVLGRIVYEARTRGNLIFENSERQEHLDAAKLAIQVAWEADQDAARWWVPGMARSFMRVAFTSTEVAASLSREAVRVDARLTDINAAFARVAESAQSATGAWARMAEEISRSVVTARPISTPVPLLRGDRVLIEQVFIDEIRRNSGAVQWIPYESLLPTPTPDQL